MMGHLSPSIKNLMVIVLLGGLVFVEGLGEVVFHNFKINPDLIYVLKLTVT